MRYLVLTLVIGCISLIHAPVNAELLYKELTHSYARAPEGQSQVLDNYLLGLYEGINAANIAYYMQTRNQLFCKPGNLDLNAGDLRKMLKEAHDAFDTNNEIPVSYLLFIGIKQTFPCL